MHNKWAIRCTTKYNKPPMEKTLKTSVDTIYQRDGRLLQHYLKGTSTTNEYTK